MNQDLVGAVFLIFVLANLLLIPPGLAAVLAARRVMAVARARVIAPRKKTET